MNRSQLFEVFTSAFLIGYFDCRQGARRNDPGEVCKYVEEIIFEQRRRIQLKETFKGGL